MLSEYDTCAQIVNDIRSEFSREHQDQSVGKENSGSSEMVLEKLKLRKLSLINSGDTSIHSNKVSSSSASQTIFLHKISNFRNLFI